MLEYNGNAYIRPFAGHSNPINSPHSTKLQQSTASIASSQSETRFSVSKYSFKTGQVTNVYRQRQIQKDYTRFLNKNQEISCSQQEFKRTGSVIIRNEDDNLEFRKNHSENLLAYRSQSCNPSIQYYKPVSEPLIKHYLPFQYYQHDNNLQRQSVLKLSKKKQLVQGNNLLKKSISQKKTIYAHRFSQLSSKANFLREEFTRQQSKMSKITSLIQQIFK